MINLTQFLRITLLKKLMSIILFSRNSERGSNFYRVHSVNFYPLLKIVDDTWFKRNGAVELLNESDKPEVTENDTKSEIDNIDY